MVESIENYGKITRIVNAKRVDVLFPAAHSPPLYTNLEILDDDNQVVATAVVWKTTESHPLWQDRPPGWTRCWVKSSDELKSGFAVRSTNQISWRAAQFKKMLALMSQTLNKLGFPKSKNLSSLKTWPRLTDPQLVSILNDIMSGVIDQLGYQGAMLATYEEGELPVRILKVKPGYEWMWEWGEEFMGLKMVGQTLVLEEHPDHIAAQCVRRILAGEKSAYGLTNRLYDLWGYVFENSQDRYLIWLMQRFLGINSVINIPFFAPGESGEPELIGNMYAGHSKLRLSNHDIAAFRAFVEQASLAIQNNRLYQIAEQRAVEAEALVGMTEFGSKLIHKMSNQLGYVPNLFDELPQIGEQSSLQAILADVMAGVKAQLDDVAVDTAVHQSLQEIVSFISEAFDAAPEANLTLSTMKGVRRRIKRARRQVTEPEIIDLLAAYQTRINHGIELAALMEIRDSIDKTLDIVDEMKRPFRKIYSHPTNIAHCFDRALNEFRLPNTVHVQRSGLPDDLMVQADDGNLIEVFRVLIKNASEAMDHQGTITITGQKDEQGYCHIQLSDTGPGVPLKHKEAIFNLFFTTKEGTGGAGLGLSWVRFYLRRIRGGISLTNPGKPGATFRLKIPAITQGS